MENHPIPQDVTGFKFKLIGSITLKQFLYVLGGGILAAVCLILPFSYIIKIPLAVFFGSIGAMLAFVPIEGRPMDVMAKNFLKALPAENQYIYRKKGAETLINEFFSPKVAPQPQRQTPQKSQENNSLEEKRKLLYGALKKSYNPDESEQQALSNINSYLQESSQSPAPNVQNADAPPSEPAPTSIAMPVQEQPGSDAVKVVAPPTPVAETPVAKPSPQVQNADSKPVFEPRREEMKVDDATSNMQNQAPQEQTQMPSMPESQDVKVVKNTSPTPSVNPNESQNVTTISQDATLKAGFPSLPDTPNIVMGIIKDPRGKILPNILVEIMDMNGIPVRAFKTNALGQFAAATPLPDGEYNVLLEDPRKQNEFEQIHIVLDGNIFEPLEIISTDQREKLRQELFGGGQQAQTA